MRQSRNLTRTMKDLESIYESILQEEVETLPKHGENIKEPSFINNSGPEAADNFKEAEVDPAKQSDKEDKKDDKSENVYKPHTFSQPKARKMTKESLNNFTMEENIFDKLYKTVMENDMLDAPEMDPMGGDEDFDALPSDDEVGGEVTVTLKPEHVECFRDIMAQLDGDDADDDLEDFDAGDDADDGLEDLPEAVHAEPAPVTVKGADNPKASNKVGNVAPKGGHAQTGKIKKADGDLEAAPDAVAKLTATGSGSNKVGATGEWGG